MTTPTPRRVDFEEGLPLSLRAFLVAGRGKLMNLSLAGAYVATPLYLLPQARVKLQIVLRREKRWIETDAIVVWENRGTVGRRDGLPPGYGVRFIDMTKETEDAIEGLLRAGATTTDPESVPPPPPVPTEPPVSFRELKPADVRPGSQTVPFTPPPPLPPREEEPEGPPYRLRKDVIRRKVPATSPGIFVLSYDRTQETRVGRADESLSLSISSFEGEYDYFYFEIIDSTEERFHRECELFHRLGGDRGQLDNTAHPEPPDSIAPDCPVCVAAKSR